MADSISQLFSTASTAAPAAADATSNLSSFNFAPLDAATNAAAPTASTMSGFSFAPLDAVSSGVPTAATTPWQANVSLPSAQVSGLPTGGSLAPVVEQYSAPAPSGSSAGGAPAGLSAGALAAPASVSTGGAGAGNFSGSPATGGSFVGALQTDGASAPVTSTSLPSSVGGTSSNNVGGNMTGGGSSWADAAKGFVKDYGALAGPLVSGGGLVASLLRGNQPMPGENQLKSSAASLASQGATLESYIANGTLPPGVASSLQSAGEAAKASIRSQYAARGMSGSDAEARDLANVDQSIVTQGASIASELLNQGASMTGMADNIYSGLMNAATQQDAALGQAISGFASSLAPRQPIIIGSTGTP